MTRNSHLLAHVVSKLTDRTEDAAVESLGYIIVRLPCRRRPIRDDLEMCVRISAIRARTQVRGPDGARPALSYGPLREDRALKVKGEFWAERTGTKARRVTLPQSHRRPHSCSCSSHPETAGVPSIEVLRRLGDESSVSDRQACRHQNACEFGAVTRYTCSRVGVCCSIECWPLRSLRPTPSNRTFGNCRRCATNRTPRHSCPFSRENSPRDFRGACFN